jgi:hypothetical protein
MLRTSDSAERTGSFAELSMIGTTVGSRNQVDHFRHAVLRKRRVSLFDYNPGLRQ